MNQQFAWVLEVRPGYEDEYKKRHEEIWPEMVDMLRNAGVRNYSIFRHGLTHFDYFGTDDLEQTTAVINASDANRRWGEYMTPIMKIKIDSQKNFPFLLRHQWHMD